MSVATAIALGQLLLLQPIAALKLPGHQISILGDPNCNGSRGSNSSNTSRISLQNRGDIEYTAQITAGDQTLTAVLDTGSFEMVVFSTECDWNCGDTSVLYNEKESRSFEKGSLVSTQFYGSGWTKSLECWDDFNAGFSNSSRQVFWKVFDADMAILQDSSFQAIVGLGPPASSFKIAQSQAESVDKRLAQMSKSGMTHKQVKDLKDLAKTSHQIARHAANSTSFVENFQLEAFSFCLGKELGSPGYVMWRDPLEKQPQGLFRTVPALDDVYWTTTLSDVSLSPLPDSKVGKSTAVGCHDGKKCNAIFDTGTSLIMVPSGAAQAVEEALDSWRNISGDCTKLSTLPDLVFTIGDERFTLPPHSYVGEVYGNLGDIDPELHRYMPHLKHMRNHPGSTLKEELLREELLLREASEREWDSDSQGYYYEPDWYYDYDDVPDSCIPLLMTLDMETEFGEAWLFGIPFFRKYYTTFKLSPGTGDSPPSPESISFAEADDDCRPKRSLTEELVPLPPRDERKPLRVDASKLRVPSWVTKNRPTFTR